MFSVEDKTSGVILSNNNCTVSFDKSLSEQTETDFVRVPYGKGSGKRYFELTVDTNSGSGLSVGISYGKPTIYIKSPYSYYYQGFIYPSDIGGKKMWEDNDVIGVAIDLDSAQRTVSFYNNGVLQLTENITNVGDELFYPFVSHYYYQPEGSATINIGNSAFKYDIPEGYEAYHNNRIYLLKKDNLFYGFRQENYNTTTKQYNPISLESNYIPTTEDFSTLGNDLIELTQDVTINGETFKPLDKFDNFKIISQKKKNVVINALKTSSELIVSRDFISRKIANNIDYFKIESTCTGVGRNKVIVSNDKGSSWFTYNDDTWTRININIPNKEFDSLTEEEITQWNNARNTILTQGIESSILNTVDFNTLEGDFVTFAYVIERPTVDDLSTIDSLTWQFDSIGSFGLIKDSEIDIETTIDTVTISPKISTDIIKVNIQLSEPSSSSSHEHLNKDDVLDKLSVDSKLNLLFNNKPLSVDTSNIENQIIEIIGNINDIELKSHSHNNSNVLNKFSENESGVMYDGQKLASATDMGDMKKEQYDTNSDGIVDKAETLEGLLATIDELNFIGGTKSNIQEQINSIKNTASGILTFEKQEW